MFTALERPGRSPIPRPSRAVVVLVIVIVLLGVLLAVPPERVQAAGEALLGVAHLVAVVGALLGGATVAFGGAALALRRR